MVFMFRFSSYIGLVILSCVPTNILSSIHYHFLDSPMSVSITVVAR